MNKEFNINFKSRNTTIKEQIKAYGLKFDNNRVVHFEGLRKAVNQLLASEILIDEVASIAFDRIFNQIVHHVKIKNNLTMSPDGIEPDAVVKKLK
jgi:hypothetical protein